MAEILQNCPCLDIAGNTKCPSTRACPKCQSIIKYPDSCTKKLVSCPQCRKAFCFVCLSSGPCNRGTCSVAPIQQRVVANWKWRRCYSWRRKIQISPVTPTIFSKDKSWSQDGKMQMCHVCNVHDIHNYTCYIPWFLLLRTKLRNFQFNVVYIIKIGIISTISTSLCI